MDECACVYSCVGVVNWSMKHAGTNTQSVHKVSSSLHRSTLATTGPSTNFEVRISNYFSKIDNLHLFGIRER